MNEITDMQNDPQCEEMRAALPLFVGGELEAADMASGERHLAGCGACRAELARFRAAREELRSLDVGDAPSPSLVVGGCVAWHRCGVSTEC